MAAIPQSVLAESLYFVENGAGTYTGDVVIPEGATLIDIIVTGIALWGAATSASLVVGDTTTPNGYFVATNLKATDLLAGESLSFGLPGGLYGADIAPNDATAATLILGQAGQVKRRVTTAERTMRATVTSVGAGTTGRTRVTFVYAPRNELVVTQ